MDRSVCGVEPCLPIIPVIPGADVMHVLLMRRADALAGYTEGSEEEAELKVIVDTLDSYEAKRWPLVRLPAACPRKQPDVFSMHSR